MGMNANFTFVLLELIFEDQLVDLPPVVSSSLPEWEFQISTIRAHIGRSLGRSTPSRGI